MPVSRQYVLAALLAAFVTLAAAVLFNVIWTVFLAVTVAYLLTPVHDRLSRRGVPPKIASAVTTTGALVVAVIPLLVIGLLTYQRRENLVALVRGLPTELSIEVGGVAYTLTFASLQSEAIATIRRAAVEVAQSAPSLTLKFGLFVLVVFGLLVRRQEVARAIFATVPGHYHDVVTSLHERTRKTLFAIYVLQVVTGIGTVAFAFPVFYLLGYEYAIPLSIIAGLLQFLPIIGPSLLVGALALYELSAGAAASAAVVAVVGLVVIGALPDLVIRPRFAGEATRLPGSLYYVGFVGGLLTVGAIGIIAGPLVVALVVEAGELLADGTD
ncbi:MAG: AI-2E family transporter [Halobacteriaceae archaeon]